MHFWTLDGLGRRAHGVLLAFLSGSFLLLFATACVTDLSHPPGVRNVRLATLAFVLAVSAVEVMWSWRGVAMFALMWPFQLLIKYLLSRDVSPLFAAIPDLFDWPLAAGLTIAIVIRQMRTIPPDPMKLESAPFPLFMKYVPAALYAFAVVTVLSVAFAYPRLKNAPPEWEVYPVDTRNFLRVSNPLSIMRLFWVGIPVIVNVAFTVAALRAVFFERTRAKFISYPIFAFLISMSIAALIVVSQIGGNWSWTAFDDGAPGGPFSNRNCVAPMLVLAAVIAAHFLRNFANKTVRMFSALGALMLILVALATGSRNAALLILALPWACLWIGAGTYRILGILVLPVALLSFLLFWMPLPSAERVNNGILRRSVTTAEQVRAGNWDSATSFRTQLWGVAGDMWKRYPVLGGGPGTFYMHGARVPETRREIIRAGFVPGIVAHSTPINLLAEVGTIACVLWLFVWLATPAAMLTQSNFSPLTLGLFILGLANLFDTPWYTSGGMTISALWLVAAFSDSKIKNAPGSPSVASSESGVS